MENKNIMVGRHQELALLQEIISSPKAELVAVYGRRRIGKTFLIDKTFPFSCISPSLKYTSKAV